MKSNYTSFVTPSPLYPLSKPVDLRREITAWRALVWAYRDENVRAATNSTEAARLADTGFAQCSMDSDRISGGLINGHLEAHADAHVIDDLVKAWYDDGLKAGRDALARCAETATPPVPASALPQLRFMPVLDRKGRIEVWSARRGRDYVEYLCPVAVEGYSAAEIQRHHEFICLFVALLEVLRGARLQKWRITSPGIDMGERIIDT